VRLRLSGVHVLQEHSVKRRLVVLQSMMLRKSFIMVTEFWRNVKMLKFKHICTDIETLSVRPNSVIVSISAVKFNINSPEVATNIKQYNGEFLVSSRVVCLQGQEVTEKLELTRRTLNVDIPSAATGDS
jgi:hypothetical protein